ncbi:MAG TPA: hypothetical protein VHZ51_11550 [Ktedonobacteraceae bacterium]|jgi:hypothetical protein|nr:hypothetical protein [Ktedonobacteraceae bacterium]
MGNQFYSSGTMRLYTNFVADSYAMSIVLVCAHRPNVLDGLAVFMQGRARSSVPISWGGPPVLR